MATIIQGSNSTTRQDAPIKPENYAFLLDQIFRASGIVLDETKAYLIEARLGPIIKSRKVGSLDDLCGLMRGPQGAAVRTQVVEAMTTNETLFFRDPGVFDAIQKTIVPEFLELRKSTRKLNVWSAAASSGQEAYSLAMMLLDMGLAGWTVNVLGTDLNNQILDRARTGRYLQIEVNRGLPAKYLVKYFERQGAEWQIKDQVRKMVEFTPFDLRDNMQPLGSFDLIMCRNVLIYFNVETKKKILAEMRRVLAPKGLLLLGSAETTLNLDSAFTRRVIETASFYQVN